MKEVRTLRMVEKQQAESELIFNRLAKMALDNIGILSKAILNKSGVKAYICEGLTATKESAFLARVKAGTAIFRSEGGDNIIGVMPQDSLVTIPSASGIVRRDIIELYLDIDNTQTDIIKRVLSETGTITTVTSDREQTYLLKARAISLGGDALSTAGSRAMVRSNPLSATLDLSSRYIVTVRDGEYGQKVQVDCRGVTPETTTLAEICAKINAAMERVAASVYDGNRIQFEGKSAGFQDYFELHPPITETAKDATNIIFSLPIVGLYIHKFFGNNGGFKICEYVVTETATEITDLYDFKNKAYWEQESASIDYERLSIEYDQLLIDGQNKTRVLSADIAQGIVAGAVSSTDRIVDGIITNNKLFNKTILSGKIANGAITTDLILDGNVTTSKFATNAVVPFAAGVNVRTITNIDEVLTYGTGFYYIAANGTGNPDPAIAYNIQYIGDSATGRIILTGAVGINGGCRKWERVRSGSSWITGWMFTGDVTSYPAINTLFLTGYNLNGSEILKIYVSHNVPLNSVSGIALPFRCILLYSDLSGTRDTYLESYGIVPYTDLQGHSMYVGINSNGTATGIVFINNGSPFVMINGIMCFVRW